METSETSKYEFKKRLFIKCLVYTSLISAFIMCVCIGINQITYNHMNVVVKKHATVEYGANKVDINDIVKEYHGDKVKIKSGIDTSVVGKQEIVLEVSKDGIKKDIRAVVDVVDNQSPVIKLNNESVTINEGDDYDLISNISSVLDNVDGDLSYLDNNSITEETKGYYTFISEDNLDSVGEHIVTLKAVDKNGNVTESKFNYIVKKVNKVVNNSNVQTFSNLPGNGSASGIVNLAYSLLGSRYVSGGNSPAGFDCSGFVQYVYAQNGKHVSRSSSTQLYDGYGVSYSEAQPGDIISWGYGSRATHSALYVGNGMMIHAANPSRGVILSNVDAWNRGSSDNIISFRRVL